MYIVHKYKKYALYMYYKRKNIMNRAISVVCRCGPHIWFSLELCGGGPTSELARQLVKRGRRLIDDQARISSWCLYKMVAQNMLLTYDL